MTQHLGISDPDMLIDCTVYLRRHDKHEALKSFAEHGHVRMSQAEFAAKHGASQQDIDLVIAHVSFFNIQVRGSHKARRQIMLTGTIGQFSQAFGIEVNDHVKRHPYQDRIASFRAHGKPKLPKHLVDIVVRIVGIGNEPIYRPHNIVTPLPDAVGRAGLPTNTAAFAIPPQNGSLYNMPTTPYTLGNKTASNGFVASSNQTVGILCLPGDGYALSDVHDTFALSNVTSTAPGGSPLVPTVDLGYPYLSTGNATNDGPNVPALSITDVSVDGTPNPGTGNGQLENLLDICQVLWFSTSTKLGIYFFKDTTDITDCYARMIHPDPGDPVCDILSFSFGASEDWADRGYFLGGDSLFQDASTLGITVLASSGDNGSPNNVLRAFMNTTLSATPGATTLTINSAASILNTAIVGMAVSGLYIPQYTRVTDIAYVSDGVNVGDGVITLSRAITNDIPAGTQLAFSLQTPIYSISGTPMPVASYPASSPWITGVGGSVIGNVTLAPSVVTPNTDFTEWVWNDNGVTGGGISMLFPVPSYQAPFNLPIDFTTGNAGRGVPDIGGNASQFSGVRLSFGGRAGVVGGTSMTCPLYAGLIANVNTRIGHNLGFLNPTLYSIAATNSPVFRQIVVGNDAFGAVSKNSNAFASSVGYPAASATGGWNGCTGLGVLDGSRFVNYLLNQTVPARIAPPTVTPVTATITDIVFTQGSTGAPIDLSAAVSNPSLLTSSYQVITNPPLQFLDGVVSVTYFRLNTGANDNNISAFYSFILKPNSPRGNGSDTGTMETASQQESGVAPPSPGTYNLRFEASSQTCYGSPFQKDVQITFVPSAGQPPTTITNIALSNTSIGPGHPPGGGAIPTFVGNISVLGGPADFTGLLSLTGPNANNYAIFDSILYTNNDTPSSGPITIVATQTGATGSPFSKTFDISVTPFTQDIWVKVKATNASGTAPFSAIVGPTTVTT